MPEYIIATDSCASLPRNIVEEFDLKILPFSYMVDDEEYPGYIEGQDLNLKKFYDQMRQGAITKTSQPSLGFALEFFRKLLESGKDLLYIGFSSGLSSGYGTCSEALDMLKKEFPDQKIYAVDSLAACMGEGLLVYLAIKEKQKGKTIEEVREWTEKNKLNLSHWFTVDDLMYLFRGGRVSKTSAYAANMLNVKPVLHVDDEGHLIPMEKTMGRNKSIKKLVEHMAETGIKPLEDQTVFICHGDCPKDAEKLANQVKERFGTQDIVIGYTSPVIGAHSGPGTLALFFLGEHR